MPNALEDSLIEEEEWFTVIGVVVHAHGFTLHTGTKRDISITLLLECMALNERGMNYLKGVFANFLS